MNIYRAGMKAQLIVVESLLDQHSLEGIPGRPRLPLTLGTTPSLGKTPGDAFESVSGKLELPSIEDQTWRLSWEEGEAKARWGEGLRH